MGDAEEERAETAGGARAGATQSWVMWAVSAATREQSRSADEEVGAAVAEDPGVFRVEDAAAGEADDVVQEALGAGRVRYWSLMLESMWPT